MAAYKTPEYHPAFEEYCETIFELREDDVDVIPVSYTHLTLPTIYSV